MSLPVIVRVTVGAMVMTAALLALAASADAHTELVSSTPTLEATLDEAPQALTLTFNEPVPARFTTVTLTVDDLVIGPLRVTNPGPESIRVEVPRGSAADRREAEWVAAYRVTSGDGHPIEGEIRFTVRADPGASATGSRSRGQSPGAGTASETEPYAEATPTSGDEPAAGNEDSQNDRTPDVIATVVIGTLALTATVLVLLVLTRGRTREDE
jgi:methionine-rich copper-binding protein CopC